MMNWKSEKLTSILLLITLLLLVINVNYYLSDLVARVDLTKDMRYSLSSFSEELLREIPEPVYIDVYLTGNLPPSFKKLQNAIKEQLQIFQTFAGNKIQYQFINPDMVKSDKAKKELMVRLSNLGIQPTNIYDKDGGEKTEKLIFPGAVLHYQGQMKGVLLLKGSQTESPQQRLNQSAENIEYELINAIDMMVNPSQKRIALLGDHGELTSGPEIAGLRESLSEKYQVEVVKTDASINQFDGLMIIKPKDKFSDADKFFIDQYVMNGGRVMFLLEGVNADIDSITSESSFAFPVEHDLLSLLFKYGIRVNHDLVQDINGSPFPVVVGNVGNQPQVRLLPMPFLPMISNFNDHAITKNLDLVNARFISSLDTVKAIGIKKIPLFFTSQYARILNAPIDISLNRLREDAKPESFNQGPVPLAYLLEGEFTSLFNNRFLPEGFQASDWKKKGKSKMVVIGDGDIAVNSVDPQSGNPYELGYNPYTREKYANAELITNAWTYLLDEQIFQAREKSFQLRLLDKVKVEEQKAFWQIINILMPILLILAFAVTRYFIIRKKYTGH